MRRSTVMIGVAIAGAAAGIATLQGTYALWQDAATSSAGTVSTGTVELLNGAGSTLAATYDWATMTASNMAPGSADTEQLSVKNAGDVAIRYRLSAFTPTNPALPLTYSATGDGRITDWHVLAPGESDTWTVTVRLDPVAGNAAQGQTGRATLTFSGTQATHVE